MTSPKGKTVFPKGNLPAPKGEVAFPKGIFTFQKAKIGRTGLKMQSYVG